MEKEYYKNLAEKYFAGDITEAEISELAGWIRNNVQLSDWWEEEFEKSDTDIPLVLRDKMFARIKAGSYDLHPHFHRFLYLQHPEYFGHRYPITLYCESR